MSNLIEQLCDLTRSRLGGGLPLTRRACELRAIVERTVTELQVTHTDRSFCVVAGDLIAGDPVAGVHWLDEHIAGRMPTILIHSRSSPLPRAMRLPTASSPGKKCRVNASFTTTTRSVVLPSRASRVRPARSAMPIVFR